VRRDDDRILIQSGLCESIAGSAEAGLSSWDTMARCVSGPRHASVPRLVFMDADRRAMAAW